MNSSKKDYRVYLEDILSAIAQIVKYTAKGKEDFFAHDLVQDGVIRQLSIIGEAAAKVPTDLQRKYKSIPWKDIIGMRNIIVHDYAETDLPTIWGTVEKDIPLLKQSVEKILEDIRHVS